MEPRAEPPSREEVPSHTSGPNSVTYHFSNLGPIKDASLGLGNLTVISGRNNTGKTYIVYSLYGLLKRWKDLINSDRFLGAVPGVQSDCETILDGISRSGHAKIPTSLAKILRRRQVIAEEIGRYSSVLFRKVFNPRRNRFDNACLGIELDEVCASSSPQPLEANFFGRKLRFTHDGDAVVVSVDALVDGEILGNATILARLYCCFLMHDLFPMPFVLSAERFGISLFFRELDFTRNQIVRLLQEYVSGGQQQQSMPFQIVDRATSRYAMPIKDNIDFTRGIPDLPDSALSLGEEKLLDKIRDMMSGHYSNRADEIRFISQARQEGHFNIPLHLASSSARALVDLYFFLRHSGRRGQLLIVDEPESHLDMANQVHFARLLARFVGAGLRVVITTHSDYIIRELNNLIMLSRDFSDKATVMRRLKYGPEDELSADSVRAYVAEDGGLTECEIGPFGINIPAFDVMIDEINKVTLDLASRMTR